MSGVGDPLVERIKLLHGESDAEGIIQLFREVAFTPDKSRLHLLTWPLPMESNLRKFAKFVNAQSIHTIYSIGCGTGLLEWLMLKFIQHETPEPEDVTKVVGVEVDNRWWNSIYSPPTFIPLQFYRETFNVGEAGFGDECDMALFCYFNNLKMFAEYLASFRGKFVVLIGPISTVQFCSPGPKELAENYSELPTNEWMMICCEQFGFIAVDHLAIYQRVES